MTSGTRGAREKISESTVQRAARPACREGREKGEQREALTGFIVGPVAMREHRAAIFDSFQRIHACRSSSSSHVRQSPVNLDTRRRRSARTPTRSLTDSNYHCLRALLWTDTNNAFSDNRQIYSLLSFRRISPGRVMVQGIVSRIYGIQSFGRSEVV